MSLVLLGLVVFAAFGVEAALGFGCNVLAVTLGLHLYPLERLLPVLVSLNLVVSAYIVLRNAHAIDARVLWRRILPWMSSGLLIGMAAFRLAGVQHLQRGFGALVVLLAAVELARLLRRSTPLVATPPRWQGVALLLGAGVTHGLYASGGPLAVYFSARALPDKRRFRSTLSLLWLLLNAVLLAGYFARGAVDRQTASMVLLLLGPLCAGIAAGEWLHRRADERSFRLLVMLLLLLGGTVLLMTHRGSTP